MVRICAEKPTNHAYPIRRDQHCRVWEAHSKTANGFPHSCYHFTPRALPKAASIHRTFERGSKRPFELYRKPPVVLWDLGASWTLNLITSATASLITSLHVRYRKALLYKSCRRPILDSFWSREVQSLRRRPHRQRIRLGRQSRSHRPYLGEMSRASGPQNRRCYLRGRWSGSSLKW